MFIKIITVLNNSQIGKNSTRRKTAQMVWPRIQNGERERKPKQFMEAQVEGIKQRGRQRITF
jgi:hypothetical protein